VREKQKELIGVQKQRKKSERIDIIPPRKNDLAPNLALYGSLWTLRRSLKIGQQGSDHLF
jgi:hypothetical protein